MTINLSLFIIVFVVRTQSCAGLVCLLSRDLQLSHCYQADEIGPGAAEMEAKEEEQEDNCIGSLISRILWLWFLVQCYKLISSLSFPSPSVTQAHLPNLQSPVGLVFAP